MVPKNKIDIAYSLTFQLRAGKSSININCAAVHWLIPFISEIWKMTKEAFRMSYNNYARKNRNRLLQLKNYKGKSNKTVGEEAPYEDQEDEDAQHLQSVALEYPIDDDKDDDENDHDNMSLNSYEGL